MSVWKKTKLMLGLAADEEYDDGYDDGTDAPTPDIAPRIGTPRPQSSVVRPAPLGTSAPSAMSNPMPKAAAPRAPQRSVVRPIPAATTAKPHVMTPTSFNDAQEIGDKFKTELPVIMNIQSLDRDLTRRLIDFASGLCYGLGGRMEKVADHVYMLTPNDVEVSAEERQRLRDDGLHDA